MVPAAVGAGFVHAPPPLPSGRVPVRVEGRVRVLTRSPPRSPRNSPRSGDVKWEDARRQAGLLEGPLHGQADAGVGGLPGKSDQAGPGARERHRTGASLPGGLQGSQRTGDKRQAVGLVQGIFHYLTQQGQVAGLERFDHQHRPADVEDGILPQDVFGQDLTAALVGK